jgi:poly(3-hydroxybutyrate) depolymerase
VKLDVVSPEGRLEAPGPRVSIGDPARSAAGSAFDFRLATGPLRPGSHILRAVLENRDGKAIFTYRRPFLALGAPAEALAVLEKQAAALGRDHALCATTAQYMVESARRATKSYGTVPFGTVVAYVFAGLYQSFVDMGWMRAAKPADPRAALARAGELIRAAQSGTDILLGMAGDIRMAYRSAVDNELVPFRVYVPSTYDRRRPAPLLVTLHGSGSDENSFFDGYNGRWIAQAEKHGYVLVSPNGRGPTSGFTVASNGQQDVLDVVALVRGRYNIDSARIFLTGHSMGGSGTVRIGARHPQLFAALAPIAGMPAEDETWKALDASRKIPMLVIAGGQDTTVPAAGCRAAAERAKALGHPVEYLEYPDADHMRVGEVAADAVFEFFNRPRRPTT